MFADRETRVRLLVALNALLLVLALTHIAVAVYDTHARVDRVTRLVHAVRSGEPTISAAAGRTLTATAMTALQVFFFGSADGSAWRFLQNVISYDFASLASNVHSTAAAVQTAFNMPFPQCQYLVQCTATYSMYCPNGAGWRYCGYNPSTVVDCSTMLCVGPGTVEGASIVKGVTSLLTSWPQVNAQTTGAAFSDGLLRLDLVMDWAKTQVDPANRALWVAAAQQCRVAVAQLNNLQWYGTYTGADGSAIQWNIQSSIAQGTNVVDQICQGIANLPMSSSDLTDSKDNDTPKSKTIKAKLQPEIEVGAKPEMKP